MKLSRRSYVVLAGVMALALTMYAGVQWMSGDSVTLPAGTKIHVNLNQSISSRSNGSGDQFEATVTNPVVVNGKTIIPAGATAKGVVTGARESGRLSGVAQLRLRLTAVEVDGDWYDVETSSISRTGPNHKKNNWAWIGGGAAGGTLIGALAGGGKGALIGGPVGAGAGLAGAAITGKRDIRMSAERELTFVLTEPATVKLRS